MKIVVDDKIPYIQEKLAMLADEVVYLPGAAITADDVRDADALIVRTRTRCDEKLLKGSRVKLVATATIGFDHIDVDYMQRAGIRWTNCPGCNSGSVAQYVECSLLLLAREKHLQLHELTIGIVGCGHVGSKVKAVAERLGMRVLVCDPPLEQQTPITHHLSPITSLPGIRLPHGPCSGRDNRQRKRSRRSHFQSRSLYYAQQLHRAYRDRESGNECSCRRRCGVAREASGRDGQWQLEAR